MDAPLTPRNNRSGPQDDDLAWLDDLEEGDEWPSLAAWRTDPTPPLTRPTGRPPALVWRLDVPHPSLSRCELLADSLPFYAPAEYERDRNGTWRYVWRERVPRAMDLTPARLVQARRHGEVVAVPAWTLARELEPLSSDAVIEGAFAFMDATLWGVVANRSIGILAPELQAERMLDLNAVAAVVRCRPATARSMHARSQLPPAQHRINRTPLWSYPVIQHWMQNR
jgi:hypothetical protein